MSTKRGDRHCFRPRSLDPDDRTLVQFLLRPGVTVRHTAYHYDSLYSRFVPRRFSKKNARFWAGKSGCAAPAAVAASPLLSGNPNSRTVFRADPAGPVHPPPVPLDPITSLTFCTGGRCCGGHQSARSGFGGSRSNSTTDLPSRSISCSRRWRIRSRRMSTASVCGPVRNGDSSSRTTSGSSSWSAV